jgi:hypothetical protein
MLKRIITFWFFLLLFAQFALGLGNKSDTLYKPFLHRFKPSLSIGVGLGYSIPYQFDYKEWLEPRFKEIFSDKFFVNLSFPIFDKDFSFLVGSSFNQKGYCYGNTTIWDGLFSILATNHYYFFADIALGMEMTIFEGVAVKGLVSKSYLLKNMSAERYLNFENVPQDYYYNLSVVLTGRISKRYVLGIQYDRGLSFFSIERNAVGMIDKATRLSGLYITLGCILF